jgi:hypothetical protein
VKRRVCGPAFRASGRKLTVECLESLADQKEFENAVFGDLSGVERVRESFDEAAQRPGGDGVSLAIL